MSPVSRENLFRYLSEQPREDSALKKALRLFLMSNLIDNMDLLDTNVPFDQAVNKGLSIFERHKSVLGVTSVADVLYDIPKADVENTVRQWLSTGWINEQDYRDIERRLSSDSTMEKVVIEKTCDQNIAYTFGYVIYFDLTLSDDESSCALIYTLLKCSPASEDRRIMDSLDDKEKSALLAYMKFKMFKLFYDTNDPVLLKLKNEAKHESVLLPADVKNYHV